MIETSIQNEQEMIETLYVSHNTNLYTKERSYALSVCLKASKDLAETM